MYSLFTADHIESLKRLDEIYFSLGKILKENERKYKCFLASELTGNLSESFYTANTFFQYEPVTDRYTCILVPVYTGTEKHLVLWNHHRIRGFNEEVIKLLKSEWRDIGAGNSYIVWALNQSSASSSEVL